MDTTIRELESYKENTETRHNRIESEHKMCACLQKLSASYAFTLTMDLLLAAFVNTEEKNKKTRQSR